MDSLKMLIKVQGERRAHFQNAVDSMKNMINMENKKEKMAVAAWHVDQLLFNDHGIRKYRIVEYRNNGNQQTRKQQWLSNRGAVFNVWCPLLGAINRSLVKTQ
jgi:hypothetical protein